MVVLLLLFFTGICYSRDTLSSGLFISKSASPQKALSFSASAGRLISAENSRANSAPLLADVDLILDDGTAENSIGASAGKNELLWLNRFTPDADDFPFDLNTISVYFLNALGLQVGDQINLIVYENTSGNTDPAVGSNFLASFSRTILTLDSWNSYDISSTPVLLNSPGDVLIGVIAMKAPGTNYYPAAIDFDSSHHRSWAGLWSTSPPPDPPTLPPDDTWLMIDDAFYAGNWLVRGYGDYLAPHPTATPDCINDGDVSQDGRVTSADAQVAFLITLGQYTPTHIEECSADCNGDSKVTAADAQLIFQTALGTANCADPL